MVLSLELKNFDLIEDPHLCKVYLYALLTYHVNGREKTKKTQLTDYNPHNNATQNVTSRAPIPSHMFWHSTILAFFPTGVCYLFIIISYCYIVITRVKLLDHPITECGIIRCCHYSYQTGDISIPVGCGCRALKKATPRSD